MKKYVLICSFIISAFTFAASHDKHKDSSQQNAVCNCNSPMMQIPGWKGDEKLMKSSMMYVAPEMQKNMIEIEQKELDIKKALLDDKVDWNKVGKLNKEIGEIKANIRTEVIKKRHETIKATPAKQ